MKSEKGVTTLSAILIVVVLMMITAVAVYVVIGPNGVLNREVVDNTIVVVEEGQANEVN